MPPRRRAALVRGLLGLWLVFCVIAAVAAARTLPTGDGFTRGVNRLGVFLFWHLVAALPGIAVFWLSRALPPGWTRRLAAIPSALYGLVILGLVLLILWSRLAGWLFAGA